MHPTNTFSTLVKAGIAALLAGTVLAGASGPAEAAGKKDPGKRVYMTKSCMACHGKDGKRAIRDYPNLAGQDAAYLVQQMNDIGSGARVGGTDDSGHPRTQGMRDIMHLVSDEEKKLVAEWLAKRDPAPPKAPETPLDPALAAAGAQTYQKLGCIACHGKDGTKPLRGYPIIAGQKFEYLVNQMTEMRDKVRTNGKSKLMFGVIRRASDEDIQKMAAYLSQIDRTAK